MWKKVLFALAIVAAAAYATKKVLVYKGIIDDRAGSIGIIGGADGPTAVYVKGKKELGSLLCTIGTKIGGFLSEAGNFISCLFAKPECLEDDLEEDWDDQENSEEIDGAK